MDFRLLDFGLWTVDCGLVDWWTGGLWTADCGLRTSHVAYRLEVVSEMNDQVRTFWERKSQRKMEFLLSLTRSTWRSSQSRLSAYPSSLVLGFCPHVSVCHPSYLDEERGTYRYQGIYPLCCRIPGPHVPFVCCNLYRYRLN